jgi:hypothetical protein
MGYYYIEGLNAKPSRSDYYFSLHYQIAVEFKPLYLIHNTCYMPSNTTRVLDVQPY